MNSKIISNETTKKTNVQKDNIFSNDKPLFWIRFWNSLIKKNININLINLGNELPKLIEKNKFIKRNIKNIIKR